MFQTKPKTPKKVPMPSILSRYWPTKLFISSVMGSIAFHFCNASAELSICELSVLSSAIVVVRVKVQLIQIEFNLRRELGE